MDKGNSPTLITLAVVQPEKVVQALATTLLPLLVAEVIRVREDAQEADEAVQLAHPVLQGGPAQGPLVAAVQCEDCLGGAAPPVLDAVGFIQNDAPPGYLRGVQIILLSIHSSIPAFMHASIKQPVESVDAVGFIQNAAPPRYLRETNPCLLIVYLCVL